MTAHAPQLPTSLPWISEFIRLDTTSRNSNRPLIDLVAAETRRLGLEPQIFPDPQGSKANLLVTVPDADGGRSGGIMLSGHTDVVPVDGQEWTSDPFEAQVRDGRLYGRGTCDMKAFSAVVVSQLARMTQTELHEPIHLALTYDEEVGCIGGGAIVKQIADLGLSPRVCIVGEPTDMQVVRGHKSINLIEVTFHGVAAHSSLTAQGVNAIEYAAEFIRVVRDQADTWREHGPYDDAYPIGHSTASVNIVSGGIAGNTVPDLCRVQLEFRTIGAVDPRQVVNTLRTHADRMQARMQSENERARVIFDVVAMVPGLETSATSAAVAVATSLGGTRSEGKVTYGTEAGQFAGSGIETIVCGPGDIAQAHAPDEYIELDQIRACEDFIAALIEQTATSRAGS